VAVGEPAAGSPPKKISQAEKLDWRSKESIKDSNVKAQFLTQANAI